MQSTYTPSPDELVSRILLRDDAQACLDRPIRDEDDFVRRISYGPKRLPENGLSLFRRGLIPDRDIYRRLCNRKKNGQIVFVPLYLGLASCQFGVFQGMSLRYLVAAHRPEHVSLRCPNCDLADSISERICQPEKGGLCPFFERYDPLELVNAFADDQRPRLRVHEK